MFNVGDDVLVYDILEGKEDGIYGAGTIIAHDEEDDHLPWRVRFQDRDGSLGVMWFMDSELELIKPCS